MNYLKTKKIVILLFASYAGALCAAAQPEERSLWQRAMDFVAEHPVATGVIGTAAAAGAYELAAHKFGLSIFGSIDKSFFEQAKIIMLARLKDKMVKPSLRDLSQGAKLFGYSFLAKIMVEQASRLYSYIDSGSDDQYVQSVKTNLEQSKGALDDVGGSYGIIGGPLLEELVFSYMPNILLGKKAQLVAPILFGVVHPQYDLKGQFMAGLVNFMHHRSLVAHPECPYAPIISHMMHNCVALAFAALLDKLNKTVAEQQGVNVNHVVIDAEGNHFQPTEQ